MSLGIVQNPQQLRQYIEQWGTVERTRSAGFKLLMAHKFVCAHCKVQSPPDKEGRLDGWLTPVDLSHPAFVMFDPKKGILLCPPCLAVQAINWSLAGDAQGMLIQAPGMEQSQLIRLAALCGVAQCFDDEYGITQQLAASVDSRIQQLADFLGSTKAYNVCTDGVEKAAQNMEFAQTLALLTPDSYANRGDIIKDILFWPLLQEFSGYYQHLRDNAPAFKFDLLQKKIQELTAGAPDSSSTR